MRCQPQQPCCRGLALAALVAAAMPGKEQPRWRQCRRSSSSSSSGYILRFDMAGWEGNISGHLCVCCWCLLADPPSAACSSAPPRVQYLLRSPLSPSFCAILFVLALASSLLGDLTVTALHGVQRHSNTDQAVHRRRGRATACRTCLLCHSRPRLILAWNDAFRYIASGHCACRPSRGTGQVRSAALASQKMRPPACIVWLAKQLPCAAGSSCR